MGENYISCQLENGSINISEDVVNSMVKTAVAEVEGVAGLSNTAGAELAELIAPKVCLASAVRPKSFPWQS